MANSCKYCGTSGLIWRYNVEYKGKVRDRILWDPIKNDYHFMCPKFVEWLEAQKLQESMSSGGWKGDAVAVGDAPPQGFKLPALNPAAAPDAIWASQVLGQVAAAQETASKALNSSLAAMQEFAITGTALKQSVTDVQQHFKATSELVAEMKTSFGQALATIDQKKQVEIIVKTESTTEVISERMHKEFHHLVKLIPIARRSGQIVFLTGEPSSGKTASITYAAKALGVPFWTQSMTMLTSLSDIEGFVSGHGNYVESPLWQAANPDGIGGIVLLDEIDASNANAMVGLNSYGANEWVTFPNGMTFKKHPKCYIVGAGNTIGSGADTRFVGRNELDMATRDRFVYLQWDIDWGLISHICAAKMGNDNWARKVKVIHDLIQKHHIEWVASARIVFFGIEAFQDGYTEADVLDMKLWPHLSADQRRQVERGLVDADVAIQGAEPVEELGGMPEPGWATGAKPW